MSFLKKVLTRMAPLNYM